MRQETFPFEGGRARNGEWEIAVKRRFREAEVGDKELHFLLLSYDFYLLS
jgi:hypothetical protein